jgi:hypothetical protein
MQVFLYHPLSSTDIIGFQLENCVKWKLAKNSRVDDIRGVAAQQIKKVAENFKFRALK